MGLFMAGLVWFWGGWDRSGMGWVGMRQQWDGVGMGWDGVGMGWDVGGAIRSDEWVRLNVTR